MSVMQFYSGPPMQFLSGVDIDSYYSVDYRQDMLKLWVAAGSPAQCVQSLQRYVEAGATTILLRVAGYDQKRQFKRVTEEILPALS